MVAISNSIVVAVVAALAFVFEVEGVPPRCAAAAGWRIADR